MQRNKFEMQAHDIQYRKRDKQEATVTGKFHNDKPLYIVTAIIVVPALIIALAIVINS